MSLRPYQESVIARALAVTERRVLICMPVGAGKTRTAAELVSRIGKPTLWIAHRRELIEQARAVLPPHVTVETIQTLYARGTRPDAEIVVWDECFPSTVNVFGKPISEFKAGDEVSCFDHDSGFATVSRVARTFKKIPTSLVKLTLDDGSSIVCTPEHPFFTGESYEKAVGCENRKVLRVRRIDDSEDVSRRCATNLLDRVPSKDKRKVHGGNEQATGSQTDAREQPDAHARYQGQDGRFAETDRTQAEGPGRERKRTNGTSGGALQGAEEIPSGDGVHCKHRKLERKQWVSESLQDRHSYRRNEDRDRSGRIQSLRARKKGPRRKEDGIFEWIGVDRVEVLEPGSDGEFGGLCPGGHVYNIEVETHNNYFADGILVHNCHRAAAETYERLQAKYPNAKHYGLTATPERADGVGLRGSFDAIVLGPSIRELINLGHLIKPTILAPATKRSTLAMPETEAWVKYCAGRQGFVFTRTVSQSERVRDELRSHNVDCMHVDGMSSDKTRELAVRRFKRGDLAVLTNCGIFTEGFDAPQASACVLARSPGHQGLYLQIVGRIMRASPGKTDAVLVDLCGVTNELGAPDAERFYSLDGISRKSPDQVLREGRLCPVCSRQNETTVSTCTRCGFDFTIADPEVRRRTIQELRSARTTDEQKLSYLKAQLYLARSRGWSEGSVWHRYKGKFGEPPPSNWRSIR